MPPKRASRPVKATEKKRKRSFRTENEERPAPAKKLKLEQPPHPSYQGSFWQVARRRTWRNTGRTTGSYDDGLIRQAKAPWEKDRRLEQPKPYTPRPDMDRNEVAESPNTAEPEWEPVRNPLDYVSELPSEILERILGYHLLHPGEIYVIHGWKIRLPRHKPQLDTAVLGVCKRLHLLGSKILYGRNVFNYVFRDPLEEESDKVLELLARRGSKEIPVDKYGHLIKQAKLHLDTNRIYSDYAGVQTRFVEALTAFPPTTRLHTFTLSLETRRLGEMSEDDDSTRGTLAVPISEFFNVSGNSNGGPAVIQALKDLQASFLSILIRETEGKSKKYKYKLTIDLRDRNDKALLGSRDEVHPAERDYALAQCLQGAQRADRRLALLSVKLHNLANSDEYRPEKDGNFWTPIYEDSQDYEGDHRYLGMLEEHRTGAPDEGRALEQGRDPAPASTPQPQRRSASQARASPPQNGVRDSAAVRTKHKSKNQPKRQRGPRGSKVSRATSFVDEPLPVVYEQKAARIENWARDVAAHTDDDDDSLSRDWGGSTGEDDGWESDAPASARGLAEAFLPGRSSLDGGGRSQSPAEESKRKCASLPEEGRQPQEENGVGGKNDAQLLQLLQPLVEYTQHNRAADGDSDGDGEGNVEAAVAEIVGSTLTAAAAYSKSGRGEQQPPPPPSPSPVLPPVRGSADDRESLRRKLEAANRKPRATLVSNPAELEAASAARKRGRRAAEGMGMGTGTAGPTPAAQAAMRDLERIKARGGGTAAGGRPEKQGRTDSRDGWESRDSRGTWGRWSRGCSA